MFQSFITGLLKPTFALVLLLSISFTGCKSEDPFEKYEKQQRDLDDKYIQEYLTFNKITNFTKTSTGLYYLPQQAGNGTKIQKGNTVTMHYIGRFLNSQKFESSYDSGLPLTFKVGANEVVRGWDEGVQMMSNQEKATLIIPSHLGYGRYGSGNIPAGTVLVFEMTVLDVK